MPDRDTRAGTIALHEITGLDLAIDDTCERLADNGYVVFAPDLCSHGFRPLCIARTLVALAATTLCPSGSSSAAWTGYALNLRSCPMPVINQS